MTTEGLREFAHWIALLPLAALYPMVAAVTLSPVVDMVRLLHMRDQLLLATAIGMSLVGDGNPQWYIWAPSQIAVAASAAVRDWKPIRVLALVVISAGAFGLYLGGPDWEPLLGLVGGICVLALGWGSPLRWPLFVYFGCAGVAFYVWMLRYARPVLDLPLFHADMLRYQGCRVAGILLLTIAIVRPLYTEVSDAH